MTQSSEKVKLKEVRNYHKRVPFGCATRKSSRGTRSGNDHLRIRVVSVVVGCMLVGLDVSV